MRNSTFISIVLMMVSSNLTLAQVNVTEIDEHFTQLDFGFHIMTVHFNIRPANEDFRSLTGGFEMNAQQRREYVSLIKDEILKLPQTFITRYVIDNVFILGIKEENTLGYHADDLIIIEGRESVFNMRRALFHEIAHEITAKSKYKPEYNSLISFFDTHRSSGNALGYLSVPKLYDAGHSSAYSQRNAEEEFCELFADLMTPNPELPLIQYVLGHPESVLAYKVNSVLKFLASNNAGDLNKEYFVNLSRTTSGGSYNPGRTIALGK